MMFLRIFRFILIASSATALLLVGNLGFSLSTPGIEQKTQLVSAKDLQINCTGPALLAGGISGTSITSFRRLGSASLSLTYSGESQTSLAGFRPEPILGYGSRQELFMSIKRSSSLKVIDKTGKTEQGSKLLSANQIQLVSNKSLKGLLAAPCIRPQSEFWLVGGSSSVGREAILMLNNPTTVDAIVDLELFTENGPSSSAGLSGISVPRGKTTLVPLASFVLRASSLSVHVTSKGGSITALIQQKAIRGTKSSGADFIAPAPVAQLTSVFPGILVRGSADSLKLRKAGDQYSDIKNILRVFVPGDKDANLTLQVLGSNEETFGTVLSVTAPAGRVSDFDIKGLADGDYFGYLESDVKVQSAIRLVRSKTTVDPYTDFAWLNAAEPFTTPRYIPVPKAGISKLSIVNPGANSTTVSIRVGGALVKTTIPASSVVVIRATPGLSIGIEPGSEPVYANLIVDVNGRVAVLPVLDDKNISGQVSVSVH